MIGARGRDRVCEEAVGSMGAFPLICGKPATCLVDNGDTHPYWMCDGCANHNVRNRGAVRWAPMSRADALAIEVKL